MRRYHNRNHHYNQSLCDFSEHDELCMEHLQHCRLPRLPEGRGALRYNIMLRNILKMVMAEYCIYVYTLIGIKEIKMISLQIHKWATTLAKAESV